MLSSAVSELELPTATKDQARAMAGQSSVQLTLDRGRILVAAAGLIESYCQRIFWRGALGGVRTSVAEVALDGAGEIPIFPGFADSSGVLVVVSFKKWSDDAESFVSADYTLRPAGRIAVADRGYFEITSSALAPVEVPGAAVEAAARVYSYQSQFRPGISTISEGGAITPPRLAGAILKSGAAELCRDLKRTRA